MALRTVLVVDDEESIRHVLTVMLNGAGFQARAVGSGEDALREMETHDYDAVLTDIRMPGIDGLELVRSVAVRWPEKTVIVMSAYASHDLALSAMREGAYDYVEKPFRGDEVVLVLRKAEERERLKRENLRLRGELATVKGAPSGLVAASSPMKEVLRVVRRVAETNATVLITGESGTGKELVARAVHDQSPRRTAPFVPVNCGALPGALMESELLGHVRGAFTGAVTAKVGLFEAADGGTLFLDEIGELPLDLQVKLLRVLQESSIRRVGDNREVHVDVRVVAATQRDLAEAAKAGKFREDLYYRLNVVQVRIPPLRERPSDIPELVNVFVDRYAARFGVRRRAVSVPALAVLQGAPWPGNVRELEHAVARALVLGEEDELGPELFERGSEELPHPARAPERPVAEMPAESLSVKAQTAILEARLIREALQRVDGNRARAAQLLDLSPRALQYKIKDYGI